MRKTFNYIGAVVLVLVGGGIAASRPAKQVEIDETGRVTGLWASVCAKVQGHDYWTHQARLLGEQRYGLMKKGNQGVSSGTKDDQSNKEALASVDRTMAAVRHRI